MTNARSYTSNGPLPQPALIRERKGAMLLLVAVVMVVLLGFLAMTLDVGSGNRQRRIAQAAADAGALAGAWELYRLQGTGSAHDSAIAIATREVVRNGFLASDIVSPCPCNPPISGPHTGDVNYIEVRLLKDISTIFGSVLGINTLTYGARGVGGVVPFAQNCLVSLYPNASGGVSVENGGLLSTTYVDGSGHQQSCGIAINSNSGSALDVNQSGQLDAGSGAIGIVGGWTGNKTPSPAPATGIAPSINPLSWVTMPTITTCDTIDLPTISKDTVLLPGVYCNGINVDSKTATLSPGTYYMAGGGFTAGTSAVINGNGVTIVTTLDPRGIATPKGINFSTGCKAKLIAPTTGTFPGIVMFGDPAMPTNTLNVFACATNDSPELTGALYFPNQNILFDGSNSGTEISGSVIAGSVTSSGKVTIMNDISGTSVVKHPSLVE